MCSWMVPNDCCFLCKSIVLTQHHINVGSLMCSLLYCFICTYILPHDATAVVVCQSICPSQAGIISKQLDKSNWYLAWGFLTPKEIWVSSKISVLLSGTLSQTLHLENFATASRLRCQQLVIIVDGRARAC